MINGAFVIKKGLLLTVLFLTILLVRNPHSVYAHFPASDGSITAILHVEPDDYPPAQKPQTIYFIFSDTSNKFKLANCSCNLSIANQGQVLLLSPLSPPNTSQLSIYSTNGIPFTFSGQGTYQIKLSGQPLLPKSFPPFNLSWKFQVGPPLDQQNGSSIATFSIFFAAILAAFLLLGAMFFLVS